MNFFLIFFPLLETAFEKRKKIKERAIASIGSSQQRVCLRASPEIARLRFSLATAQIARRRAQGGVDACSGGGGLGQSESAVEEAALEIERLLTNSLSDMCACFGCDSLAARQVAAVRDKLRLLPDASGGGEQRSPTERFGTGATRLTGDGECGRIVVGGCASSSEKLEKGRSANMGERIAILGSLEELD